MIVNIKTNSNYLDRTETLVDYFNDIKKLPNGFSMEDESVLFDFYKNGTEEEKEEVRKEIIEANQRFVISVARRYATNNDILDLIDEGNIGLMEAIDAFDPNVQVDGKTVRFITFAVHYIRRAITQYKVNNDGIVKKTNNQKTYHVIAQARSAFMQKNGRQPTPDELKDYVNENYHLNIRHNIDLLDLSVTRINESAGLNGNDNETSEMATYHTYSASENTYNKTTDNEYQKEMVKNLLTVLTPREQEIVKMSYGIDEIRELTCEEISRRLNLTTERIRQLKANALKRLKKEFKRVLVEDL